MRLARCEAYLGPVVLIAGILLPRPAWTGVIIGMVEDAATGQPLADVNVILATDGRGVSSDASGRFELADIGPGTHTLRATLVGYAAATRTFSTGADERMEVLLRLSQAPIELSEILVRADRSLSAASSRTVRQFDLQVRPGRSPQQMLQMVPGLFIAQHAGGGKAEQIFLRGFDNDHGTDVAIVVDGMPVNMVSQTHGHGYADLHFLIPETVEAMEVYKGPYFAEYGNPANAGQVVLHTRDRIERNAARLEQGAFGSTRYTMLYQLAPDDVPTSAYFAGNFYRTDGPFDSPQGLKRLNLFAKSSHASRGRDSHVRGQWLECRLECLGADTAAGGRRRPHHPVGGD